MILTTYYITNMSGNPQKFIFDLSTNEITNRLQKVVVNVLREQKEQNLPLVYKNPFCLKKNEFIHEYPDGRKFLIRQNPNTSEERVIKQLY